MGWFSGPDATLAVDFYDDPKYSPEVCRVSVTYSRRTDSSIEQTATDFAGYVNCVLMALGDSPSSTVLHRTLSGVLNAALGADTEQDASSLHSIRLVPAALQPMVSCRATFTSGNMPKVSFDRRENERFATASCIAWLEDTVQKLPKDRLVQFADQLHTPLRLDTKPSLEHLLNQAESRFLAVLTELPPTAFVRDWGLACLAAAASFWNSFLLEPTEPSTTDDGMPLNAFQAERDRLTAEGIDELFRLFVVYRLFVFCISEENQRFIRRVDAFVENFITNVFDVFGLSEEHATVYEELSEPDPSRRAIRFFNVVARRAFQMEPPQDAVQMMYFTMTLSGSAQPFMTVLNNILAQSSKR